MVITKGTPFFKYIGNIFIAQHHVWRRSCRIAPLPKHFERPKHFTMLPEERHQFLVKNTRNIVRSLALLLRAQNFGQYLLYAALEQQLGTHDASGCIS